MIDNSKRAIELRRNQNALAVFGTGILTFAVWNFAKTVGVIFAQKNDIIEYFKTFLEVPGTGVPDGLIFGFVLVIVVLSLLLDLLVRLYIARAAFAESRGKHKSILYLILTCLLIASVAYSIVSIITGSNDTDLTQALGDNNTIITAIIELTQAVLLAEMIAASVRVRRLTGRGRHSKE